VRHDVRARIASLSADGAPDNQKIRLNPDSHLPENGLAEYGLAEYGGLAGIIHWSFHYQFNVRNSSDLRVCCPKHHAPCGAWFARANGKRL